MDSSSRFYALKVFLFANRYFITFCILISVTAFGFELSNVAISIDEETASMMAEPMRVWFHMDRWGMYLLQQILPLHPPLPFVSIGLGMMFNLITLICCLKIWSLEKGLAKYLAAVFALAHPVIAFTYAFNQSQYGYYLGLLLAVFGVKLFIKYHRISPKWGFPIICWILSMSLYQSVIFAAPTVFSLYALSRHLRGENISWKLVGSFGFCLLLGVICHEAIAGLIRQLYGITHRYHTIESFYTGELLAHFDLVFIFKEIVAQLIGHRWYVGYATGAVLVVSLYFLVMKIFTRDRKIFGFMLLSAALVSPFIFVILTSRIWPARTMMALPILMAGIVYVAQPFWQRSVSNIVIFLIGYCFLFYTASITRLFYADYVAWQNDKLFANRITAAIEQKFGEALSRDTFSLVIVGQPKEFEMPIRIHEETFGGSIFEWDGGNQHRIHALFKIIGINYFTQPSRSQITVGYERAKELPAWPHNDAITSEAGTIIVKLSDPIER